jgi:hypothetical protein
MDALKSKDYESCAKQYKCSVNSIKSSVHNSNVKIKEMLGYPHADILKLIKDGELDEAEYLFMYRTTKNPLSRLFPAEILTEFPVTILECKEIEEQELIKQLITLRRLTVNSLKSVMSTVSSDVLSLLSFMFNSDNPKLIHGQVMIFQYLMHGMDTTELAEQMGIDIKDIDI